MKAVIVYEEIEFATKACAALQRVASREDVNVQWIVECWPASALRESAFAEASLRKTLDAQLIVLPAGYAQSLSAWLLDWLKRWAGNRQNSEVALAFIDDRIAVGLPNQICAELSILVREQGLNLIAGRSPASDDPPEAFIDFLPAQEVAPAVGRTNFPDLTTHHSYRGMGINE
jgi:hypothetical protein